MSIIGWYSTMCAPPELTSASKNEKLNARLCHSFHLLPLLLHQLCQLHSLPYQHNHKRMTCCQILTATFIITWYSTLLQPLLLTSAFNNGKLNVDNYPLYLPHHLLPHQCLEPLHQFHYHLLHHLCFLIKWTLQLKQS